MQRRPITAEGFHRLQQELKKLKSVERIQIMHNIAEARAHGDLSENAEYHAAKEQQGFNEAKIHEFEELLGVAEVIDTKRLTKSDSVIFGAYVKVNDEDKNQEFTYRIVGEMESDADQGSISITSPIARALIGKMVGDIVEVTTPGGTRTLEVSEISF